MAEALKERKDMDPAYQWDLSSLYTDDAAWETALQGLDECITKTAAFEGTLTTAEAIRAYFDASTELGGQLSDVFSYAFMRKSEDTRQEAAQSMYSRAYAKYVQAETALSFAEPEILSLPEETLRAFTETEVLKPYHYQMVKLLRQKPHTLSAAEEKLLAGLGEVMAVPKNVADNLQDADLLFDAVKDSAGEEHELNGSNFILLETSQDRTLRENAFRSFYKSYQNHIHTFAAAYAGQVKADIAEAGMRHYESAQAMYAFGEGVPTTVCDHLIAAVHKWMPLMYRYVALRKKILGVSELHYYDLYAPLSAGVQRSYSYEEAQSMILDAIRPLGDDYRATVQRGFREHWIDVYPNRGKEGGAYSNSTYRSKPYILTNFTGTLDAVSTIAHEMGHSMHSYLSNHHQPQQNADYTIFVAEVASTVNENLLVEDLLSQSGDDQEKMALLNQYLEGFKGTVYRQTMFAEFEKRAHEMAARGEALHASSLSKLYRELIAQYFGPELVIDEEVQYEWARIPHFYSPFYVYKYATSYSAAVAISDALLHEGEAARKRYLAFLSLGGSMDPLEELRHAGVDFTSPAPVEAALRKFEEVLDAAEKLIAE